MADSRNSSAEEGEKILCTTGERPALRFRNLPRRSRPRCRKGAGNRALHALRTLRCQRLKRLRRRENLPDLRWARCRRPPSRDFYPTIHLPRMPWRGRNDFRSLPKLQRRRPRPARQPHQAPHPSRRRYRNAAALLRNGDSGVRGGPAGDLYVFLHVKDHDVFERDDADLFCSVPLPFSVAALGGELK
ncbi:MAG: hypothetical protein HC767_09905, partial [Akkermansiaceae bacterium]|nr:hypothetical protein [Akkermansiaceae bacterium]